MGRTSDAKERLMAAVRDLIWSGSYGTTTIDQICEKAMVKKGSFYYFFESKSDLAVASLQESSLAYQAELDTIFSISNAPMDRLRSYAESGYKCQVDLKRKYGRMLGCPLFSLGAEISTHEQKLRETIQQVLNLHRRYLESTIRDGQADGSFAVTDTQAAARAVLTYFEGLYTQARIYNEMIPPTESHANVLRLLGAQNQLA